MLTTQYELFKMNERESIQDMHTNFTSISNGLHCLVEVLKISMLVRKILSVLVESWENVIIEAKDHMTLTMDELIGNLKTYELKKQQNQESQEPKNEKNMSLKATMGDSSKEDIDTTYNTTQFQRIMRKKKDFSEKVI